MVTPSHPRRDYPAYPLSRIKELAAAGDVVIVGDRTWTHLRTYSYSVDDICRCLSDLQESDFHHSVLYPNSSSWNDVYKMTNRNEKVNRVDDLYIKVRVNRDDSGVVVLSFHPEGAM